MTQANPEDYYELYTLINEKKHTEHECRKYLHFALDLLVPYSASTRIIEYDSEYVSHTGKSDLIILAERTVAGILERSAFIWEIKSPQCFLFKYDTQNRAIPSNEFVSAENQLLHYYSDYRCEKFRSEFQINDLDNIKFGGILIGRDDTLLGGDYEDSKRRRIYQNALKLRRTHLYSSTGIQILVWNDVLNFIKPVSPITEERSETVNPIEIQTNEKAGINREINSI